MPDLPTDLTMTDRKEDHIDLAFRSQVDGAGLDGRFDYEPLLAAHPAPGSLPDVPFGDKTLRAPLWVSSMTGGTEKAYIINHNLARACHEFGLGMGLGSCRPLLEGTDRLRDFDIRSLTGDAVPLFANLGIAQIEDLLDANRVAEIGQLLDLLSVDGLIIHVNPLQEWLQPEGDRFRQSPLAIIEATLAALPERHFIVKEVGQGMGPASLRALLDLPLLALDTAANGGTNFAKLELYRSNEASRAAYEGVARLGHSAAEMVATLRELLGENETAPACQHLIISGGVRDFLDGYYLTETAPLPAIYGQASAFLRHAQRDYASLAAYVTTQLRGLELARAYLRPRI